MKNIHDIIDMLHSDPAGISLKFGIPIRTVYSWCEGKRTPPDYVIMMMFNIILLEKSLKRRLAINGKQEEKLEGRMGADC